MEGEQQVRGIAVLRTMRADRLGDRADPAGVECGSRADEMRDWRIAWSSFLHLSSFDENRGRGSRNPRPQRCRVRMRW
jgi:hypothetical protein